jgi:translation initiation factor 1
MADYGSGILAFVSDRGSRSVYETGRGRLCPKCGWPAADCRCSKAAAEPVPGTLRCVLRLEKKGRGGKSVTVVADLPRNQAFLSALAAELKRACGTGGTVADGAVEIQGDQRERLRPLLLAKGWVVRG